MGQPMTTTPQSSEAAFADGGRWHVATAFDGEMPIVLRIRSVPESFPRSDYPFLLSIVWPYESSDDSGMPSDDVKQRMDVLEDLLVQSLEGESNSLFTLVVTGNAVRVWQLYSRAVDDTMTLLNGALAEHERFPIEISLDEDPGWEAFAPFQQGH